MLPNRASARTCLLPVVFLASIIGVPVPIPAQVEPQLSIAATKQWTSVERALDPVGLTVGFAVWPASTVGIRATWTQLWGSRAYAQTFCDSYWPISSNCSSEQATHHASVRRLELGVSVIPIEARGWRLTVGAGGGWTWLRASGASLVSGRAEEGVLSASSRGLALWSGIARKLDQRGRISGSIEVHRLIGEHPDGCATDTFAPFCQSFSGTSMRVGLIFAPR